MQHNEHCGAFFMGKNKAKKVSLNEFSFTNDIDPAILSRIETGKQNIKLNILEKISKGFNKTPAEFLTEFENFKEN